MKITKSKLKQIIKEEISSVVLKENEEVEEAEWAMEDAIQRYLETLIGGWDDLDDPDAFSKAEVKVAKKFKQIIRKLKPAVDYSRPADNGYPDTYEDDPEEYAKRIASLEARGINLA